MQASTLWYKQSANNWNEALPLGNGHMAAMAYCGEEIDRIQINNDTLWSGLPSAHKESDQRAHLARIRQLITEGHLTEAQHIVEEHMLGDWNQSYLSLGELQIQRYDTAGDKDNYRRELKLDSALLESSYSIKGCAFNSQYFMSAKDNILCIDYTAEQAKINLEIGMRSLHKKIITVTDSSMLIQGQAPAHIEPEYAAEHPGINWDKGMGYSILMKFSTDGITRVQGDSLIIQDASNVRIYLVSETAFNGYDINPVTQGKDHLTLCQNRLHDVQDYSYDDLRKRHVADYQSLYGRVNFSLGNSMNHLPTDVRIKAYGQGEKKDINLFKLLFDFGRYMLIVGSREGSQPLTLQGKWNKDLRPYWSSNLTVNINVQMNYWASESCHLTECHEPLFRLLEELHITGRNTAKSYGCRGWAAHHNLDIWRNTNATGIKNKKPGKARHAFWPFSGVWLCQHLWEHYAYTKDQSFLYKVYPIMKDAALFCLDWLYKNENGTFVSAPSTSPENQFIYKGEKCAISQTSTMDIAMIRDLWMNIIEASKVLDQDTSFSSELEEAMKHFPEYQIGSYGQLQEWIEDYEEFEPGHRHQSHLFALYPGKDITPLTTPDLAEACKKSIENRLAHGGGYTGWSCAWIISLYCRLLDSKGVQKTLDTLMCQSIYTNMMDAHPPMQADGNYGALAGITEALLQSYNGYVHFLPALPTSWKDGVIEGLIARGNFEVTMTWQKGCLLEAHVISHSGSPCSIYVDEYPAYTITCDQKPVSYTHESNTICFDTEKGKTYTLTLLP